MPRASWIPAFAGMTRGHKYWQCIEEMDSSSDTAARVRGHVVSDCSVAQGTVEL